MGQKMVSGLDHLLERVQTSDLVQRGRGLGHLPDVVAEKHSCGPLGASGGPKRPNQTKQTMVGIEVVRGTLEQVGRVQRAQK